MGFAKALRLRLLQKTLLNPLQAVFCLRKLPPRRKLAISAETKNAIICSAAVVRDESLLLLYGCRVVCAAGRNFYFFPSGTWFFSSKHISKRSVLLATVYQGPARSSAVLSLRISMLFWPKERTRQSIRICHMKVSKFFHFCGFQEGADAIFEVFHSKAGHDIPELMWHQVFWR